MKKILLYVIAIFMLIGCADNLYNEQLGIDKGKKVKLIFRTSIPKVSSVASRSFSEPSVNTLHLIVFDNNGYLVEKKEATKEKIIVSDEEVTEFSVILTASASPRNIHFIGNYNGVDQLTFGSESDVVGGMKHDNNEDAYWQRMTFNIIEEGTEFGTIPLIRNHAKITVENQTSNFKLESFTVVNIVTEGYVAPYNMNNGSFAQFLDINGDNYTVRKYDEITKGSDGYIGYFPSTTELNLKTTIDDEKDWVKDNSPFFLYERGFEADNHTFILVKGSYIDANNVTHEPSYYKIDLVYKDANNIMQYYHLLRNFHYAIKIKNVTGNGKSDAQEAYDMAGAHNNLSASIELQSLTNISDGSSRLYVNYTEETIVSSNNVILLYKYIPDVSTDIINNDAVSPIWESGEVISLLEKSDTDETDNNEGWRRITITPQLPDANETKKQSITLTVSNLSRTITYILRTPYVMDMQCYDGNGTDRTDKVVDADISEKVNIDITLPTGLPESLFPLTFFIEAEKRTLYPDVSMNQNLPVEMGISSLFNDGTTFGYIKEITWEMYNASNRFTCYFLTNTETSASQVRVYNKYFSIAEDSFTNT